MSPVARPRVVILGGGFAGLYAAKALRRAPVEVVVVDRCNHHLFQPLLYQVATAGLGAPDIASPIRKVLARQRNASVLYAEARGFDLARREVRLADGVLGYDRLIVAVGASHGYFGKDHWAPFAPGLKTLRDAYEIRTRVLRAYERAEREPDARVRAAETTFVVVGGGPTGVELAGALAELARHTLARDFRRVEPRRSRVVLVEGTERVLPTFPPELCAKAAAQLQRLGVEVRTSTFVTAIDERGVELGAERIEARTVLWAAGVSASPLVAALGAPCDRAGRALVEPDLSLPGHPEVSVIGDAAAIACDGKPVPGVAPAAIQMGRHVARNLRRVLAGGEPLPFRYRDKGSLATVGRFAAVADFGRVRVAGPLAWVLWFTVHLYFLIGFRARLVLLFEWSWAWLTYQRVARVFSRPAGD